MTQILAQLMVSLTIAQLLFLPLGQEAYAESAIPEVNLAYPVLIKVGKDNLGSGFYVSTPSAFYLVTARHVLYGSSRTKAGEQHNLLFPIIMCLSYPEKQNEKGVFIFSINLKQLENSKLIKQHDKFDVVVVRLGYLKEHALELMPEVSKLSMASGRVISADINNLKKLGKVSIGNEIFVFGYPSSLGLTGLNQYDYDRPLLRRGIVAGKNDLTSTLIIDTPVYHGNSGGPIVEVEKDFFQTRFDIIGIAIQLVPAIENGSKHGVPTQDVLNSGYSVVLSVNPILELLSSFEGQ